MLSILRRTRRLLVVSPRLLPALLLAVSTTARAQQLISTAPATDSSSLDSSLPDSPTPQTTTTPEHTDQQTTRILGILPNFRAVSANQHLPPQSVKEKFVTASEDSFDYSALFVPVVLAGYNELRTNTPEFGGGGLGYARYLWHSAVDQTIENYMVEFVVPAATHEDTRFYTLGNGGFWHRTGYALSRAVVTRSDSGKPTFNASEILGAGAAAGISNLYYPSHERTVSNTMENWGIDVAIDAAAFVLKEFWPDINHALFHGEKPFKDATPAAANH
jgi:hypothetical protein